MASEQHNGGIEAGCPFHALKFNHTNKHFSEFLHDTDFLSIHNAHIDKSSLNLQINFAITTSLSQLRPINQRFLEPRIPEICGLRGLKPERHLSGDIYKILNTNAFQ